MRMFCMCAGRSAEVGAGFQCLYDNQHGLWDAMAGFWVTVATRFASTPNVLGYELINEVT